MSPSEEEQLDVDDAIARLQAALRLQYRSALEQIDLLERVRRDPGAGA